MKYVPITFLTLLLLSPPSVLADRQPWPLPPEATRLQVLLLGYTRKDGVGRACQKDIVAFKKMLLDAFNGPDLRQCLIIHDLTGDLWSGPGILEFVSRMTIDKNDVVLIYHSGHGGDMVPAWPEESHLLNLNRGGLSRLRLRQALLFHQPRGLILLTDCCSSWFKGFRNVSLEAAPWPRREVNWGTLRNLLLRTPKLIDITAAEDGRMAQAAHLAHQGTGAESAFTVALLALLHDPHEFQNWSEFFPSLKQYTREASGGTHQPRYFKLEEMLGSPLAAPVKAVRPTAAAELFNRLTGGMVPPPLVAPTSARHSDAPPASRTPSFGRP